MSDSIERGLGRIEGKVDQLLTQFSNHADEDDERFKDVTSQLEGLRLWRATVIGGSLALSAMGGILARLLLG